MSAQRHIIIADSAGIRSDETNSLALSLSSRAPLSVKMFDAHSIFDKDALTREIALHVSGLLSQESDVIVVMNCIMGVQAGLIKALRGLEDTEKQSVGKILLTCKKPYEIRSGFTERGLRLEGIEHIVWDVRNPSLHRNRMKSIFQGESPQANLI